MSNSLRAWGAALAVLCLVACGPRPGPASSGISLQDELRRLDSLPRPASVDPDSWLQLKAALRGVLEERLDAGRIALTAPLADASQATLSLDPDSLTLSWLFFSQGDYDQNGEVNIGELTPLGLHFGASSGGTGAFPVASVQSVVDGDGNGEINLGDITPVGVNFGRACQSYNVYRSLSADDLPAANGDPNGPGAELMGTVPLGDATGNAAQGRLALSFVLPELKLGWFYWVRPNDSADGSGQDGTPSTLVSFGGKPDNEPPVAAISASPTGCPAPLTVDFDASGSTDPDGANGDISDIVQFQWDFDGNGTVDETTSTPQASHSYTSGGSFDATVTVADAGAAFDSASLDIGVDNASNQPPSASLTATPDSGETPLAVSLDASGSSDPDGSIVAVEWDFDGDGTFDANTGTTLSILQTYPDAGSFEAKVRVTDNEGASAEATASVTSSDAAANQPPLPVLNADVTSGDAPLTVTFDASDSSDPDGGIVKFEFRPTGIGLFTEVDDPANMVFQFQSAGAFEAQLRVTDNEGLQATGSVDIIVSNAGNLPPAAILEADVTAGPKPLTVNFDASGSFDPDGSITLFEWNFDGDSSFDETGPSPTTSHTYTETGTFQASVSVTDDGGLKATASLAISTDDPDNQPPVANLQATNTEGDRPLVVSLDASASTDSDGTIEHYLWDFDGDGETEFDSGSNPLLDHSYYAEGQHAVTVTAIDDDGASDTSSKVTVTVLTGWQIVTVASGVTPRSIQTATLTVDSASLPCIAYVTDSGDGQKLRFVRANGSRGLAWAAPVTVVEGPVADSMDLAIVSSNPAIAFNRSGGDNVGGLSFVRSSAADGSSWGAPLDIDLDGAGVAGGGISLAVVQSKPAIAYGQSTLPNVKFVAAENSLGTAWGTPVQALSDNQATRVKFVSMLLAAGKPALVCTMENTPSLDTFADYVTALDAAGAGWGSLVTIAPILSNVTSAYGALVGGNPAACYPRPVSSQTHLNFLRAQDGAGADWPTDPVVIGIPDVGSQLRQVDLKVVGKPCSAFHHLFNGELMFAMALDSSGASWGDLEVVDGKDNSGSVCALANAGVKPAIAYTDLATSTLRFAILNNP